MKRVVWAAAAVSAALLAGCNSPHLSLAPPSPVSVPAGTSLVFTGLIQDSDGTVLWKLDGPGSLSNTSGLQTVYTAPSTFDPSNDKATLTASISNATDEKQVVQITIGKGSSTAGGIPGLVSTVTVTYDERDIPTINCTKSVDCYSVLGYIHARDRLFQMDFYRRVAEGRISELVGEGGLAQDEALRTFFTTRDGRSMLEVLTAHTQEDPLLAPVLTAYVAGVNAYIAQVRADPSRLPAAYKQLQYVINPTSTDDLPDWAPIDSLAVGRLFQFQLSEDAEGEGDNGKWASTWAALIASGTAMDPGKLSIGLWLQSKSPIEAFTLAGSGAANAPSLVAEPSTLDSLRSNRGAIDAASAKLDALRAVRALRGEPPGSNNWVVDGQHTDIGKAFIANDPHQPLTYPSNFHLSHLIGTEDSLNVLGACFPGVPVALVGRGAHVGWGATVVGYDVTDLYVETLAALPDGGPAVSFLGQPVGIINVPQTYKFRTAAGLASLTSAPAVRVSPPHGPIISAGPSAGTAISVRWTGQEALTDDVRAFLRLNNATSVEDGRLALEGDPKPDGGSYTGYYTGAQNFVLADDHGNIAYVPHACVPQRPWASQMFYPYPVVPMDGRGMFEWASGPDGGLLCVSNDLLPRAYPIDGGTGSNKGYLATANFDPLGTTVDNNPYSNPGGVPYLSFDWDDLGFRIARIQEVLDAKLANGGKVTLADMQALQTDHVMIAARPFLDYISALSQADQIPAGSNSAAAAAILLAWAAGSDGGAPTLDCPTGLAPGSLDPATAVNDPSPINSANSKACLLFHTFFRRVLEATFADEEAVAGIGRTPKNEVRAFLTLLSGHVPNPNNVFCRDVGSDGAPQNNKTCQTQVLDALGFAYAQLKGAYGDESNWRWGRQHTITFEFIVSGYPLIDPGFRPGPFPRPGGAWTVDVGRPTNLDSSTLTFPYGSGGAVRWLAAMDGTVANTFNQLPGMQNSDAPYPFGKETMLTDWVLNKYFNWPFQPADVTSVRIETFNP